MASYYVAPILSHGAGTLANPWGVPDLVTIGTPTRPGVALSTPVAGDTLYFRGGTYSISGDGVNYTTQMIGPTHSGTASQPITLRPYPGEAVNLVCTAGRQPTCGTSFPVINYVRFLGLSVDPGPGIASPPIPPVAFYISGTGNEVGYCEVIGRYAASIDNHDGIRIDFATNAWIHHNNIHDITGNSHNSAGIKMYADIATIVEDNYIHACNSAMYDKDAGTTDYSNQTVCRRNFFTNTSDLPFVGQVNSSHIGIEYIYDNVMDGGTSNGLGLWLNSVNTSPANQCQVYNNLFRGIAGSAPRVISGYQGVQQNVWNNISLSGGVAVTGFYEYYTAFTPSGPSAPLAFMDYNVYDGAPTYKFGQFSTPSSFTLTQFQGQGFEINAHVTAATNIFVDQVAYVLKGIYPTAGRYGDMVGPRSSSPVGRTNNYQPNSVASILNTARYGPAAIPGLTTPGYVSETGLLMVYCEGNVSDLNNLVTAITSNPSFFKNGSGTPMAVTGPFWRDVRKDSCLVAYRPNTPLLLTDSVTMTTTAGWATTTAGAMPAVTLQALTNNFGQPEPSVGNFGGIAYPGFDQDSSQWTMPLGYNITHGGESIYFAMYYSFANAIHRETAGMAAVASTDANGNPLTLGAKYAISCLWGNSAGFADSRGCPEPMGVYRFIADESAPATPMVVTLTGTANVTISAPTITGTGVGKTWAWTVAYSPANPVSYFANLTLNIDKPVGGSFPCDWTLGTNFRLQMPGNPTRPTSNYAIDENVRDWLTTPSNKIPEFLRWVDAIIGSNGISTQVDQGDMLNPLEPFWNPAQTTVNITAFRNFDPVRSPYTYWSQHWPNATTPGGGPPSAPYGVATSAGMENFTGVNTGWIMTEAVYDNSVYQLKSYQTIQFGAGIPLLPCTNGNLPNVNCNISSMGVTIFMTSPTTFVFSWFPPGTANVSRPTNTTGIAGNINTLVGTTAVTTTASLRVPDTGTVGYAGSAHVTGELGSGYHMNIPAGATDAFVTAAAAQVFANYPSGGSVLVEYSNELWSIIGSMLGMYMLGNCQALSHTYTTRSQTAVLRARQVHDLVVAAAATAGWTGTIIRAFGSQYGNIGETTAIISFVNTYNAANPGSPIQVDAVLVAPYMPAPAFTDVTLNAACASVYAQNPASTQFGNANPFTRSQWWDLFAHQIKYYTADNGPAGRAALTLNALRQYVPVNAQPAGFVPAMRGYEGGLQNVYTGSTATGAGATAMNLQLMHDLQYDPMARKFDLANYQSWQFSGFSHVNIYGLCMIRQPPNVWPQYMWAGQQPGPGDGTVNGVTNLFYSDTGQAEDYHNQSVRGDMWREWADVTNPATAPQDAEGAITLGALVPAGVGTFRTTATGAITLGSLGKSIVGTFRTTASGAVALGGLAVAGTGTFTTENAGDGAITLGSLATSGVGTFVQTNVVGEITLGPLAVSGTGTFAHATADGAITLDSLTVAGVGTFEITAAGTITLDSLAVSGAGTTTAVTVALSGPSTSVQGIASSPFSVTPNLQWTGSIAFSDGGAGGTFHPLIPLNWVDANNTQTFTYTAAIAGLVTITATANPVVTINGSPFSLTVSAAPTTVPIYFVNPKGFQVIH